MARAAAPRLLGALALGVLALLGLAREAVAAPVPELSIVEDWKIEGVYDTSSGLGLSYGVFFDPYTHDEYMYIVHNTTVDMYHLPSSRGLGEPVLERSFSTGSSCAQSSSWVIWPNLITTHGDLPFCTCAWSEDDPCPKRVSITGTTTGEDGLYELGVNNILKVDQVPLVEGALGLGFSSTNETAEDRTWACEPLINPEAVAGKYCVVDRGGCFFQTKHDHCLEAGAIGTVIVNRDPSVITLSVQEVAKGHPFFMVGSDTGDIMKNNPDATIASGKPIGEPEPQPGYSGPDGLSIVNVYTGKRVNW